MCMDCSFVLLDALCFKHYAESRNFSCLTVNFYDLDDRGSISGRSRNFFSSPPALELTQTPIQ
jgi:hypothetical protein